MLKLKTLAVIALTLVTATPALALSCMPYSPRHAFQDANKSPDRYVIAHGQVDFNARNLPVVDMNRQDQTPPDTIFNGHVSGFSLTAGGFTARFERQIKINVQCFGPWCGALQPGIDYLMFLKQDGNDYFLETNPCGGYAFANPPQDLLKDMRHCLLGKDCDPFQY